MTSFNLAVLVPAKAGNCPSKHGGSAPCFLYLWPRLQNPRISADKERTMTATCTQTLYAPNPPQLDEPWLKLAVICVAVVLIVTLVAALAVGS